MTSTPLVGNTFFGLDISQLGSKLMSVRRRLSKRILLLEFSSSGLRYAEASPSLDGIRLSHISRVALPEEALERGVPSDPVMMASLVRALCQEKAIPAHRAAVVLSPDVAYQRIIELPPDLTTEKASSYLRDPANAVPLPFPLEQTDFDLYPLTRSSGSNLQPYLLIAIPQTLIDRVISLLDEAQLELHALELGPFSLLRFLADELVSLGESEMHLVLELLPDCSQLCVVGSSGPSRFERLSAIRDFPEPDLDDEQLKNALEAGLSAEALTLKDERYLPISELDLRAVLRDLKAVLSDLVSEDDTKVLRGITLSGVNSSHPLIKDLFQEVLNCDVKVLNPVLMSRITGFSSDDLLVSTGLARLLGLGLGFLPQEQLLSCFMKESPSTKVLAPLPSLPVDVIIDSHEQKRTPMMDPLDVEVQKISTDEDTLDVREVSLIQEEDCKFAEDSVEKEYSSLGLDLSVREESVEVDEESVEEEEEVIEGEKKWPSINAIPGLEASAFKPRPGKLQSNSQSKPTEDESSSSSLGELRFQDE